MHNLTCEWTTLAVHMNIANIKNTVKFRKDPQWLIKTTWVSWTIHTTLLSPILHTKHQLHHTESLSLLVNSTLFLKPAKIHGLFGISTTNATHTPLSGDLLCLCLAYGTQMNCCHLHRGYQSSLNLHDRLRQYPPDYTNTISIFIQSQPNCLADPVCWLHITKHCLYTVLLQRMVVAVYPRRLCHLSPPSNFRAASRLFNSLIWLVMHSFMAVRCHRNVIFKELYCLE